MTAWGKSFNALQSSCRLDLLTLSEPTIDMTKSTVNRSSANPSTSSSSPTVGSHPKFICFRLAHAPKMLLREVDEELCVRLSLSDLDQCVITAVLSGTAILVFAHMTGLSRSRFKKQMGFRHKHPPCQREMSDISHVPVSQLQNYAISSFVSQEIHAIKSATKQMSLHRSVHIGKKWC